MIRLSIVGLVLLLCSGSLTAEDEKTGSGGSPDAGSITGEYGGNYEWLMQKGVRQALTCVISAGKEDGVFSASYKAMYNKKEQAYSGTLAYDKKTGAVTGEAVGGGYTYEVKGTILDGDFVADFFYSKGPYRIPKGTKHGDIQLKAGAEAKGTKVKKKKKKKQ